MIINKGWSFCIVTAPNNEEVLLKCIKKIQDEFQNVEEYEILVVGNPSIEKEALIENVRILPFREEVFSLKSSNLKRVIKEKSFRRLFFITGAISRKKNIAAKSAKYDKLCMMHDYVGIEENWRRGFCDFGEDWEVAMNIILNKDSSRHRDWMNWDYPLSNSQKITACLLPYDKRNKYMYISGTFFCIKKEFFLENLLDESLMWGEAEDVEWSLRIRGKTQFKMNTLSTVKYLKLKSLSEAPYCIDWTENERKLLKLLNKNV